MLTPVATHRDILIFRDDAHYLTIAADTLGAIGEKPHDVLAAPPELCARLTMRVCLLETLAVGAEPEAVIALTCNEREPTGVRLLAGLQAECADAGYAHLPLTGSTEDNMPTGMTAFGITLLGACATLRNQRTHPGDGIYLVGLPYVGPEVLARRDAVLTPQHLRRLRAMPVIGDLIPCGSRGAAWELQVLERETGLSVQPDPAVSSDLLHKSAGPATCAIATARAPFALQGISVMRLGTISDCSRHCPASHAQ